MDVGDETEKLFAQALAVDPKERPRDAGELWGGLKHAMQVDGRTSARSSARKALAEEGVPSTLRMDRESASMPVSGGTLRIGPGAPRTASEWLTSTPLPARVSGAPSGQSPQSPPLAQSPPAAPPPTAPQPLPFGLQATMPAVGRGAVSATLIGSGRPPPPMGSSPPPAMGPSATLARPAAPPLMHAPGAAFAAFDNASVRATGVMQGPLGQAPLGQAPLGQAPLGQAPLGALPPGAMATGVVRMTPPPPAVRADFSQITVRRERRSSTPVVVGVALAILVVAGAAAAGWHYLHAQPEPPAPAAQP